MSRTIQILPGDALHVAKGGIMRHRVTSHTAVRVLEFKHDVRVFVVAVDPRASCALVLAEGHVGWVRYDDVFDVERYS